MARQSHCTKLVQFWRSNPRFVSAGPAASAVWLRLALLMEALGDPVGFAFGYGSGSGFGSPVELALALHLSETELETHLEALVARGLLRREADGALLLPAELAPSAKAQAARINGLKGGRPRKDGSPPGQRSMMLPLAGGGDTKPIENPTGNQDGSRLDRLYDSEDSSNQTVGGEAETLGSEVAALVGVRPGRAVMGHVARWLRQGATPELVLGTVRRVLERVPSGSRIESLRYFEGPIRNALANGPAAAEPLAPSHRSDPEEPEVAAARRRWLDDFARWDKLTRDMNPLDWPVEPDKEAYLAEGRAAAAAREAGGATAGGVGQAA